MKSTKKYLGYIKEDWADLIEFMYEDDFVKRNPGHGFLNRKCFYLQDMKDEITKFQIKKAESFFGGITNVNIRWHEQQIEKEKAGQK